MNALTTRSGKSAAPLHASIVRELELSDIIVGTQTTLGKKAPTLQRLRDTHHYIAKLLAQGLPAVEVSAISGMSQSRISVLQNDPAFVELLEFYRERAQESFVDVVDRLKILATEATAELHHRIIEQANDLSVNELIRIAEMGHDRSGTGPTHKSVNRNETLVLTPADLEQMKKEAAEQHGGKVYQRGLPNSGGPAGRLAAPHGAETPSSETGGGKEGSYVRTEGGTTS